MTRKPIKILVLCTHESTYVLQLYTYMKKYYPHIQYSLLTKKSAELYYREHLNLENDEVIYDEKAEQELYQFIEDNELAFIVDNIIKPVISELSERGRNSQSKLNVEEWKRLEFAYIMDVVMEDSQKRRITLSQLAKGSNVSIQNVRTRHAKVMDELFQRMWNYMTLSYSELFARLRGSHKVPHKLICFDPGKTTGWCTFVDGRLDH